MSDLALSTRVVVTRHAGPTAAGTTAINGATLDMLGFDGVLFVTSFGTITSTAVTSLKAQEGAASDASDMADLAGTGVTVPDTASNKSFYVDLVRPKKRYVRAVVSRGTANAVVGEIYAIQYTARSQPTAFAVASTMTGVVKIDPIEGTP